MAGRVLKLRSERLAQYRRLFALHHRHVLLCYHNHLSLSSILRLPTQAKVSLHCPALSLNSNLENFVCVEDVDSTWNEGKIVAATRDSELEVVSIGLSSMQ
jgi:hypothetical protein